jgi:hypothetical protein
MDVTGEPRLSAFQHKLLRQIGDTDTAPAFGGAPRLETLNSHPSSSPDSFLSSGQVTVRSTSTHGSTSSFVMPCSRMDRGCTPQRSIRNTGGWAGQQVAHADTDRTECVVNCSRICRYCVSVGKTYARNVEGD